MVHQEWTSSDLLSAGLPRLIDTRRVCHVARWRSRERRHGTDQDVLYLGDIWRPNQTTWHPGILWKSMECWYMLVHYAHSHTVSLFHYFSHLYTFIWYCDVQYQMRIRDPETHKQGNPSFHYDMPNRGMTTHPSKRSAQSLCHWLWHPSHANTHAWHIGDDVLTAHCFGPLPFPQ